MRDERGGIAAAAMYTQYPQYPAVAAQSRDDKLSKSVKDPLVALVRWLKRRNPTEKMVLIGLSAIVVRAEPCPPSRSYTASLLEILWRFGLINFRTYRSNANFARQRGDGRSAGCMAGGCRHRALPL